MLEYPDVNDEQFETARRRLCSVMMSSMAEFTDNQFCILIGTVRPIPSYYEAIFVLNDRSTGRTKSKPLKNFNNHTELLHNILHTSYLFI